MSRARSREALDGERAGGCSGSKGRMTLFMEPPCSTGLSSRCAISCPFLAGWTPKRRDLVAWAAWDCTIDKYMWTEKGKEEREKRGGAGGGVRHMVGNEDMRFFLPDLLPTNWVVEIM